MALFRALLIAMVTSVVGYTLTVGINDGWNLLPLFFSEILAMTWSGQFNLDFTCFLILGGLWIAWRHQFAPVGLGLGLMVPVGGVIMLASYLLVATFQTGASVEGILLGKKRLAQ